MTAGPDDPAPTGAPRSGAVHLSRNEVETLCAKAARGAGMAWGQAEEAGFAAGWLVAHGIDGAAAILSLLDGAAGSAWDDIAPVAAPGRWAPAGAGPICPIVGGSALGDHCDLPEGALTDGLSLGPVRQPVLLLPFLSEIARHRGEAIKAAWPGGAVVLDAGGAIHGVADGLIALDTATLTLSLAPATADPADAPCVPGCDPAILRRLDAFALRTTVPPSDRSRADAGAAGTDND